MDTSHLDFEPPGPGTWFSLSTHWTRPVTRFLAEIYPDAFSAGHASAARRFGLLIDRCQFGFTGRLPYWSPVPLGVLTERPPQSKAEFDALIETDRTLAECAAAADRAIRDRAWRDDLSRWDGRDKPQLLERYRLLQAVDPAVLTGGELITHIAACREHLRRAIELHHTYTMPAILPLGDLMAHVEDWTGQPGSAVLRLLRGWSAVSVDGTDELHRAAEAIRADPVAQAVLAGHDPAKCVSELCRMPATARGSVSAYIRLVADRPVNGHDISEPCCIELPELLVSALREAVAGTAAPRPPDTDAIVAGLRDQVPAGHRHEFDALLLEARTIYRLRDERDLLNDGCAEGIARRAILAAGDRLAADSAVDEPAHLAEAGFDEIRALLLRSGGPSAAELAARADYAATTSPAAAPPMFGPPPATIPAEWMPAAMARIDRARDLGIGAIFATASGEDGSAVVRGQGIGGGSYVGPARIVRGTGDFTRLHPGDVLIAPMTTPVFNVVLPLIGALATDRGGLLSHAAIVAREAGIPAVVGCGDITRRIRDGSTVRVDGTAGEVRPLN